jgi:hypothetical protein
MEPHRIDPRDGAGVPPAAALDPRLLEALRSALTVIAQEGHAAGPTPEPFNEGPKAPRRGRFPSLRGQFWPIALALFLSGAAALAIVSYLHLGAELAGTRKEIGQARREMGLLRTGQVRKDEFSSRNLAAHALLREVEANNRAAVDSSGDRFQEQKQALNELRANLKEVQKGAEQLQDRLKARQKRRGTKPSPVPAKEK